MISPRLPPEMAGPSKRRLGRGLDGLLPAAPKDGAGGSAARAAVREVPIEQLRPGAGQPRAYFDEEALGELSESIKAMGILEPILVRKSKDRSGADYEIIAGERRWRAAQRAGLKDVPIFVRELSDQAALEAALVENLQREDLNPIETAKALKRLIDQHGHTQETVAERIGKDRSTVANALRLLKLPDVVLRLVQTGELSEGHGRAVLAAQDVTAMTRLAEGAVKGGWSVRETERQARAAIKGKGKKGTKAEKSANVKDLEKRLSHALGCKVQIEDKKGKGKVQLAYSSWDELDRLIDRIL